jgi:hypothetical protein
MDSGLCLYTVILCAGNCFHSFTHPEVGAPLPPSPVRRWSTEGRIAAAFEDERGDGGAAMMGCVFGSAGLPSPTALSAPVLCLSSS